MVCGWRRAAAGPALASGCRRWFANRHHLLGHRRPPARLRLLAQGHARRGGARPAALRRDAPLHPRGRLLDGRERGRDAGEPPAAHARAQQVRPRAAPCACCSTSSPSSSCWPTARGPRTCSALWGWCPAAPGFGILAYLTYVKLFQDEAIGGRPLLLLGRAALPDRRHPGHASACWRSCWCASTTRARASRPTW